MKNLIGFVLLLVLGALWAQPPATIYGQMDVINERLTWGSDSAIQLRFLVGQVHRDTSTPDTLQHWKRIDNTADSCSNPVYIGRTVSPVWKFALHEMVYARDPDSSTIVYRWEVRRRRLQHRKDTTWGPWVAMRQGVGTVNDPVQDSVVMPNITDVAASTWSARYGLFFLGDGVQARACPDQTAGTAITNTDTLITRNHRLIGR